MFSYARLGCFLLACVVGTAGASAQQSAPQTEAGAGSGAGRMYLDVVVAAKSGQPVAGLQQQDFTLSDNKAPRTITSFQAVSGRDAPISVTLVIDAVNDTADNIRYERLQIDKFLRADGGNLKYPVALAVFTDTGIKGVTDFSIDGGAIADALQKDSIGLRDIGRTSGYWGATERVQLSLTALNQLVASEAARLERKVILWISPGWPLLYQPEIGLDPKLQQQTFKNIVAMSSDLLRARVTLYSVDPIGAGESVARAGYYRNFLKGISKPSQTQVADLGLQVLAVQSGGLALNSGNDIAALLEECMADTAPYYEISFAPASSEKADEYHRLDVRVAKPGLTARTRQGYYAQPSPRK
jgi:VWFA-related protein